MVCNSQARERTASMVEVLNSLTDLYMGYLKLLRLRASEPVQTFLAGVPFLTLHDLFVNVWDVFLQSPPDLWGELLEKITLLHFWLASEYTQQPGAPPPPDWASKAKTASAELTLSAWVAYREVLPRLRKNPELGVSLYGEMVRLLKRITGWLFM